MWGCSASRLTQMGEFLGRSQQPGIEEIEDGPQIAEPVFDGRAGEGKPRLAVQFLGSTSLLGIGILDGLRLVQHHQAPLSASSQGRRRSEP